MKISIMQMYDAMNITPEFVEVVSLAGAERVAKGKANRSLCLQLIKDGELCMNELVKLVRVDRTTMLAMLKEFSAAGLIEFFSSIGKQSKILNVL